MGLASSAGPFTYPLCELVTNIFDTQFPHLHNVVIKITCDLEII